MYEMRPYHNNRRNHMASYNPFRELDNLERSFFANPFGFFGGDALASFKTDIKDNGKEYVLEADLPGFDKKDIHLDIDNDVLTIHAQRNFEREERNDQDNYVHCERSWGSYSRQFDLSGVDADNMHAKYENGVLTLTMPKKDPKPDSSRHLEID